MSRTNKYKLIAFISSLIFVTVVSASSNETTSSAKKSLIPRCKFLVKRVAAGTVIASTGLLIHQAISNHAFRSHSADTKILSTRGASITSGTAASLSLLMRMRYHFQDFNIDLQKLMNGQTIEIMTDYFFPTNFPEMDQVNDQELAQLVKNRLSERLTQHTYVLIGTLIDASLLSETATNNLKNQPDHPVLFINQILSSTEKRRAAIKIINQTIVEMSVANPHLIVIDHQKFAEALATTGYRSPSGYLYHASDLIPDKIHFNDNGVSASFNFAIKPALEKIPALNNKIPDMPMRNAYQRTVQLLNFLTPLRKIASDFQSLAIETQVKSADEFARKIEGDYWTTFGAEARRDLKKSSPEEFNLSKSSIYSGELENLRKIEEKIKSLIWLASPGFVVSRRIEDGKEILTANLSQIVFFTSINLYETAPGSGEYKGYGYDFWWSVDHDHPPKVNYQFTAKVDPRDSKKIDFVWNIFPLVRDSTGQLIQEDPSIRLGTLPPQWLEVISKEGDQIPHLSLKFSTQMR